MQEESVHKPIKCAYCGDAPVSHAFSYTSNLMSMFFDSFFSVSLHKIPNFIIRWVDDFLQFLLRLLVDAKIIKLSSDIERATTLRSKVIWEEALRRGIKMEQLVVFGKYTDNYRAFVGGKYIYFNSIPVKTEQIISKNNWDDKFFLKTKLSALGIPVPKYAKVPILGRDQRILFESFQKPMIVKPRSGSRGRHTTTNIHTWQEFKDAVARARVISPQVVAEEEIFGYVCRATCVGGKLAGFYRADAARVVGDGFGTVRELIEIKNKNRKERVEEIKISPEMESFIGRAGFSLDSVLPKGRELKLSYRTGRYFGGETKEMLGELHPTFIPIFEKAAGVVGLSVLGFDVIVSNPEKSADSQRFGIIECNTLPFIDLHYFALEGKPRNIAGMIWDFWTK